MQHHPSMYFDDVHPEQAENVDVFLGIRVFNVALCKSCELIVWMWISPGEMVQRLLGVQELHYYVVVVVWICG